MISSFLRTAATLLWVFMGIVCVVKSYHVADDLKTLYGAVGILLVAVATISIDVRPK